MHPRSPYQTPEPDSLQPPSALDFKDPAAVRELAKCLLKRDFGLEVELHESRLCPMIPNRLDYVLWIQDLVDSTGTSPLLGYDPHRPVLGLDVGTGASCIYPILACSQRSSWSMIATDINAESVAFARQNVQNNVAQLGGRVQIREVDPQGPLFPLDKLGIQRLDFTMCNPPFFTSIDDMFASAKGKGLPPSSACTGTTTEMVYTDNGELGFAQRMLKESILLRERIKWYTTLFGKLSSVVAFVKDLKAVAGIDGNWAIGNFQQGITKRWAVAWSYCDRRPTQSTSVSKSSSLKGCSPFPPESTIQITSNPEHLVKAVSTLLTGLQLLRVEWLRDGQIVIGEAAGDVWSRSARRAAQRGTLSLGEDVRLGFLMEIMENHVLVRWTRGRDALLFESFRGMMRRKLQELTPAC